MDEEVVLEMDEEVFKGPIFDYLFGQDEFPDGIPLADQRAA